MAQFDPKQLMGGGGNSRPPNPADYIKLGAVLFLEGAMLTLFLGAFSETMGFASNVLLSELPGVGKLFAIIDEDATVSHLLAFLLAVFSVAVPIMIWSVVLAEKVYLDHQRWLANPVNRVRAIVALALYATVFLLEVVNFYTLIAQQSAGNPFAAVTDLDPLTRFIAQNKVLGIFVSVLIAVVNLFLGLLTVVTAQSISQHKKG